MEIIKVGIFMDERPFAEALAVGLARESAAMHFYLLNRLEEGDFCDLILSSAESGDPRVVHMVRDLSETSTESPPYRIYRYRESQNLINDLLFIYFRMTGRVPDPKGRTRCRLVMFLADSGGCGTTSAALAVAGMLYQIYGSRSLYLNLCPLDDSKKYLEAGGRENLQKLLYYLDQEKNFPVGMFITEREQFDYVGTGVINTYFNEMKPYLMNRFLEKVDLLGIYDFVITDIGNHLSRENRNLLRYADTAVLFSDGERNCPGKYRETIAREIISQMERGRLIRVENFASDNCGAEDTDTLVITRQPDADLRLEKQYGLEISYIAREIMEGKDHERG